MYLQTKNYGKKLQKGGRIGGEAFGASDRTQKINVTLKKGYQIFLCKTYQKLEKIPNEPGLSDFSLYNIPKLGHSYQMTLTFHSKAFQNIPK
jgi:hypothetical protein